MGHRSKAGLLFRFTDWNPPKVNHRKRKMVTKNQVWEMYVAVSGTRSSGTTRMEKVGQLTGTFEEAKYSAKLLGIPIGKKIYLQLVERYPKVCKGIKA